MVYLLIVVGIYAITTTILLLFFTGSRRDDEKELESLFRYYDYCESVRLEKIDAEIAYLETLYGVDDYMKGKRENNKS